MIGTYILALAIGYIADFLPPVLFLHVFFAFPSGRVEGRVERVLVGLAYGATVGFSLVRMMLGAFGSQNLLSLVDKPVFPRGLEQIQLLTISAISLVAIGALVVRRRGSGGRQRTRDGAVARRALPLHHGVREVGGCALEQGLPRRMIGPGRHAGRLSGRAERAVAHLALHQRLLGPCEGPGARLSMTIRADRSPASFSG